MRAMSRMDTKWFRERLAEKGLSQRALARKLGLDQSAISLTFGGRRRMKFEEAAGIARLFSLPVSDVLRHAGMPVDDPNQRPGRPDGRRRHRVGPAGHPHPDLRETT